MKCFLKNDLTHHHSPSVVILMAGAIALAAFYSTNDVADETGEVEGARAAVAEIESIEGGDISGSIRFREMGDFIRISGTVDGLSQGKHGFHVHEGTSCEDRGGHFNPDDQPHGSPDEPERHVGDLGNLAAGEGGSAAYERIDRLVALSGERSVIGHALVIHQNADEYLPQPSGNSGTEIACGVIRPEGGE